MLIPRRVKHRKQHHPGRSGAATGGSLIAFGDYGIQALEPAYVTNRQIESARIAMTRYIKRGGKVWINIYPTAPSPRSLLETPDGFRQGVAGVVDRQRQARPRHVRASPVCPSPSPARRCGWPCTRRSMKCRFVRREGVVTSDGCRDQGPGVREPAWVRRRPPRGRA